MSKSKNAIELLEGIIKRGGRLEWMPMSPGGSNMHLLVDSWLITSERTLSELLESLPELADYAETVIEAAESERKPEPKKPQGISVTIGGTIASNEKQTS